MNLSNLFRYETINNGLFIAKSDKISVILKKAKTITIGRERINFSKVCRREKRSLKRRKLAKRLLWKILRKDNFLDKKELIQGF